jgi:murein DD-endopeptidase MepM/ murein hydrolase activator NlpD
MKKFSVFLLVGLAVYLIIGLYFLDKEYFLCPIQYQREIVIRNDNRGDGNFAADRNGNRVHNGVDLSSDIGSPVLAARSGRARVLCQPKGMGNYIIIQHPGNISTLYGHLSRVYVGNNEFVRQGEVIGAVGRTGNAGYRDMQPHLHFEVRRNGVLQDPMEYLE